MVPGSNPGETTNKTITLLDYAARSYEVEIPDDTEYISEVVVSGDQILEYPHHFDTGVGRITDFYDGSFKVTKENFNKLKTMKDPYDIFEL